MTRSTTTILRSILALGMLAAMAGGASAQSYRYMDCDELWYARNEIYAENGYCFQTQRAIRTFGEACFAPWGKLSRSEQREVDLIVSWEKRKGCR